MTTPQFHQLHLSKDFENIEFISDLHLDPSHPATFNAWKNYMLSTQADAIFILGDLFESWVGSDILDAVSPLGDFERDCTAVIQKSAENAIIYILAGNRDFLLDKDFAKATDITLLPDPTVLLWAKSRTIISHGDLLCTDDIAYQEYRKMVHSPQWQQQALAMPIAQRIQVAKQMRQQSEQSKQNNADEIMDVNPETVSSWMQAAEATRIIHGHTHRPADHTLTEDQTRIVLSDWDLDTTPEKQRAEVLQWSVTEGLRRIPINT